MIIDNASVTTSQGGNTRVMKHLEHLFSFDFISSLNIFFLAFLGHSHAILDILIFIFFSIDLTPVLWKMSSWTGFWLDR